MTATDTTTEAALVHDVHWKIDYRVKLGRAWSRFMRGLQKQELWGTRCESCQRSYVPAQDYCEACYEKITNWVQLEPTGTLRAATIVYQGFEGGPEAPYVVGAVEIDGTHSLLMHFIGGVDLSDSDAARAVLRDGLRVRAVWSDERTAAITDIKHFAVEQA
ncbi:Zn-ribbon domain-containing OB-fold protein [Arthrobacter sp. ISL-28]|uniref:Zn-ribbon domain-containing OB-fold protein n=1 Tax=Arthrobacter sp. ISL-28 TaxID=2819108 RepID=UPI001BEBF156|nr:Zn-ribbon domain-containing OB-fold protein [Arthrobacter sp. ISL-28]MBT2523332.1 Zn-ribbon domain-containing OB-fold protein [Arthrobacter sp. ISL-28]